MITYLLLTAHFGACFNIYISNSECMTMGYCWIVKYQLMDSSLYEKYVKSLYFIISTMTTIGYESYAETHKEKLFQIFCMVLSCTMFAYVIGSFGRIFSKFYDYEVEFSNKVKNIMRYLNEKDVNKPLKKKIKKFLDFQLNKRIEDTIDERDVLKLLNDSLVDEINIEINGQILYNFGYFNSYEKILILLSRQLKNEMLNKNEKVFSVK